LESGSRDKKLLEGHWKAAIFLTRSGRSDRIPVTHVISRNRCFVGCRRVCKQFGSYLNDPFGIYPLCLSFGVIAVLFALIFKFIPDTNILWSDVRMGAAITSLLFTFGKVVIGFYLGHSAFTSAYGAAASLVIFLIWIFYSAQILLFGAELTHVYALSTDHERG
jgi:hypothetical protein